MKPENLLKKSENFELLCDMTARKSLPIITGGNNSFYAFLAGEFFNRKKESLLITMPDEESAETFYGDIQNFVDADSIIFYPAPDLFVPAEAISLLTFERVSVLFRLANTTRPYVLVSYPHALAKKVPLLREIKDEGMEPAAGKPCRRSRLINVLIAGGYKEDVVVEEEGRFARRGGIIDIFPMNADFPVRIEFRGNAVKSLRKFEVATQLSFEKTEKLTILPLNESFIGEERVDLLSELHSAIKFFICPLDYKNSKLCTELVKKRFLDQSWLDRLQKDSVILQKTATPEMGDGRASIHFNVSGVGERFNNGALFCWKPYPKERVWVFSDNPSQQSRLKEILAARGQKTPRTTFIGRPLSAGFSLPSEDITFLSNDEFFARYKRRHSPLKHASPVPLASYAEIKEGDYVVHYMEGIGILRGLEEISAGGKNEEFIVIEYRDSDKLYIPVDQISMVHKYEGAKNPRLSKLGSRQWIRAKEKVKTAIRDMAADLYTLYKERLQEKGAPFMADDELQKEFDESFIYTETPGQQRAIEEIKNDMVSEKIMDRIVCGDSGYGKTEVAMRAAFKAVLSGTQVAVLSPTTVLTLQHFLTFRERFADFPVRIEMLSRLVPQEEQKQILKDTEDGKVDIIIGTHKLLSKDVAFKKPGLLVIDEEQRFGVAHKERLKTIFKKIDVLTLTATPIPRTMHMALSGLRDISLIETPPLGRLSVVTYLGKYEDRIVKEAILRELERNGQVFYLHNYIRDIHNRTASIRQLVPFAKVEYAHGRMAPEELSGIMKRFSSGQTDILVATTIVENGIDIPRANTLIVDNAHRYGLADLYQLRGRVGRYKWRAYAYFLIPPHLPVTKEAGEKLAALQELNRPGSGYKVAIKDLEIRGAGSLLGKQQHGFIEQVGFNLYCRFWQEVVDEIKGKKAVPHKKMQIKDPFPKEYIGSPTLRFYFYRKLYSLGSRQEAAALIAELRDMIGSVPREINAAVKKAAESNMKQV